MKMRLLLAACGLVASAAVLPVAADARHHDGYHGGRHGYHGGGHYRGGYGYHRGYRDGWHRGGYYRPRYYGHRGWNRCRWVWRHGYRVRRCY